MFPNLEEMNGIEAQNHLSRVMMRLGSLDKEHILYKDFDNRAGMIKKHLYDLARDNSIFCDCGYLIDHETLTCVKCKKEHERTEGRFVLRLWEAPMDRRMDLTAIIEGKIYTQTTKNIRCSDCGSPASYKELQIRSADESATLFFKCTNDGCGKTWREGA